MKIFGSTPSWFISYKDQGIVTIGRTPGTSSQHPSAPATRLGIIAINIQNVL